MKFGIERAISESASKGSSGSWAASTRMFDTGWTLTPGGANPSFLITHNLMAIPRYVDIYGATSAAGANVAKAFAHHVGFYTGQALAINGSAIVHGVTGGPVTVGVFPTVAFPRALSITNINAATVVIGLWDVATGLPIAVPENVYYSFGVYIGAMVNDLTTTQISVTLDLDGFANSGAAGRFILNDGNDYYRIIIRP